VGGFPDRHILSGRPFWKIPQRARSPQDAHVARSPHGEVSYRRENTSLPLCNSGGSPYPYRGHTEIKMDNVPEKAREAYKTGAIPMYPRFSFYIQYTCI
jgi:hypothetical protein